MFEFCGKWIWIVLPQFIHFLAKQTIFFVREFLQKFKNKHFAWEFVLPFGTIAAIFVYEILDSQENKQKIAFLAMTIPLS